MSKYFGRLARVQIEVPGDDNPILFPLVANTQFDVQSFTFGPQDLVVSPAKKVAALSDKLHLRFKAEKDALGAPNRLDLAVFNLSPATRGRLKTKDAYVTLQAGYLDDAGNLPTIFAGNARTIDHQRDGANWTTRIQCGDGETSFQYAPVNQSWGKGIQKSEIAAQLARTLKAADPKHIRIDNFLARLESTSTFGPQRVTQSTISFPVSTFYSGYAVFGSAFEELRKLLGKDYDLFVLDGELVALTTTQTSPGEAFVLDAAHGLIGSPEHCSPNPGSSVSILKAKSLLNGRFNPGTLIRVESVDQEVTGNYRIQKVEHLGDLAANEWYSEMELFPL
jgi:hypothetical protein